MLIYVIEDSVLGLYSAVFHAYKNKERPDLIVPAGAAVQPDLSAVVKNIESTAAGSKRVENGVRERLLPKSLEELDFALASGDDKKYTVIFRFLCLLLDKGRQVTDMLFLPEVVAYNDLSGAVANEARLLRGFVRFKESADGYFYAQIKPVHNITKFIMPHFADRYNNMTFAIHDIGRNVIGLYNTKKYRVFQNFGRVDVTLSDEEAEFSDMWKQYYKNVSITERTNLKLRNSFLPRKFRQMMDETQEI